jgi:hypothetical protein
MHLVCIGAGNVGLIHVRPALDAREVQGRRDGHEHPDPTQHADGSRVAAPAGSPHDEQTQQPETDDPKRRVLEHLLTTRVQKQEPQQERRAAAEEQEPAPDAGTDAVRTAAGAANLDAEQHGEQHRRLQHPTERALEQLLDLLHRDAGRVVDEARVDHLVEPEVIDAVADDIPIQREPQQRQQRQPGSARPRGEDRAEDHVAYSGPS